MEDIDHRLMHAPFLDLRKQTRAGDSTVALWDFRVTQPNVSPLDWPSVHSLEHFLNVELDRHEAVFNVAPLGCHTGFYITTIDLTDFEQMAGLLVGALTAIDSATSVPLANVIKCGAASTHSLSGAQDVARFLRIARPEWGVVLRATDVPLGAATT